MRYPFWSGYALGVASAPVIMGAWYLLYYGARGVFGAGLRHLRRKTWI